MRENTENLKSKSQTMLDQNLESLTKVDLRISLMKSLHKDLRIPKEVIKPLLSLLSTAYGNNQEGKGLAAIIQDRNLKTPPVLMMGIPSRELLDLLWENEKILGTILDFFQRETRSLWDSSTGGD